MFVINCPYCGERDQQEFKAGGEAHIERPKQPTELSDDEWAEYLFMRKNIKGIQLERWVHIHGCRKWFNMVRDTSNDQIHAVYKNKKNWCCSCWSFKRNRKYGWLKTTTRK